MEQRLGRSLLVVGLKMLGLKMLRAPGEVVVLVLGGGRGGGGERVLGVGWAGQGDAGEMLRRAGRNLLRDLFAALAMNLACFDWTR